MDIVATLNAERSRLKGELEAVEKALSAAHNVRSRTSHRLKGTVSAAARRRIAQAQKARWAKWRKDRG